MQFSVMCSTAASPTTFLAQFYHRMCDRMNSSPLLQAIFQSSVKFNRNILSEIDPLQPEGEERFQSTGMSMRSQTFQKNSEKILFFHVLQRERRKTNNIKRGEQYPQEASWKYDQSLQFLLKVRCPHWFSAKWYSCSYNEHDFTFYFS